MKGIEISFIISTDPALGELTKAAAALEPWLIEVDSPLRRFGKLTIYEFDLDKRTFRRKEYVDATKTRLITVWHAGEGTARITCLVKNGKRAMQAVKDALAPQLEMFAMA